MRWFARERSESPQAAAEKLDRAPRTEPRPEPAPELDAEHGTALGWDAITAASAVVYPGQTPHRWVTLVSRAVGGDDPLDLIAVYRATDPQPHWHYVTYGLSDVLSAADPPSDLSPALASVASGFGFELTFRLVDPAAADPDAHPPVWPTTLLSGLARYVVDTSNVFAPGHFISTHGPLTTSVPTGLVALGFVEDPDLGTISAPHGQVRFLQAVGLTADEVDLGSAWAMGSFLDLLVADDELGAPRGLTDLARASIAADPRVRVQVESATARDGSSIGVLFGEQVSLEADDDQAVLTLSTAAVPGVARTLPGRIPYGRPLRLVGNDGAVTLRPGPAFAVETSTLVLDDDAMEAFADALDDDPGDHAVPGLPLLLRVVPTARRPHPDPRPSAPRQLVSSVPTARRS